MKSTLRIAIAALAIGAFALASAVASTARDAGTAIVRGAGLAVGLLLTPFGDIVAEKYLQWGQRFGMVAGLVSFADAYTGKYPVLITPPNSDVLEVLIPFNFPAAAPGVNDILALCKVPAGVKIVDWTIVTDRADSNGAPTLAFSLGSLNDQAAPTALTTTYAAAIATSQSANGVLRAITTAAFLESAAAIRPVGLLFTAAAATYVAGKTGLLVLRISDY
jgi:hypothetical protein